MLRVKYVSNITSNPVPSTTMYEVRNTASPFELGTTYKTTMKSPHFERRDDLGQSRASIASRKSFNADDYLQSLKYKLKDREHNYSKHDFLTQEREYLKNSSEGMKKELESQQLNNLSMNIYEKHGIDKTHSILPKSNLNTVKLDKKPAKFNNILKGADSIENFEEIRQEESKAVERKEDVFDF
jgi:hypothetical protein